MDLSRIDSQYGTVPGSAGGGGKVEVQIALLYLQAPQQPECVLEYHWGLGPLLTLFPLSIASYGNIGNLDGWAKKPFLITAVPLTLDLTQNLWERHLKGAGHYSPWLQPNC